MSLPTYICLLLFLLGAADPNIHGLFIVDFLFLEALGLEDFLQTLYRGPI